MIFTIIIFLVILGLLVFVHEFGHFVTAKRMGLRVDEFGFGFPPRFLGIQRLAGEIVEKMSEKEENVSLMVDTYDSKKHWEVIREMNVEKREEIDRVTAVKKWRLIWGNSKAAEKTKGLKGDTVYSLNWIPLGGFVKIYGEEGEGKENKRSFASQKPGRRAAILFAGVTMNVVLAAILISFGFFIGLPQEVTEANMSRARDVKIQIIDLAGGSPAQKAGLKMGDSILKISEEKTGANLAPAKIEEIQDFTKNHLGSTLMVEVLRGKERLILPVLARKEFPANQGAMGIAMAKVGIVSFPWYQSVWEGVKTTLNLLLNIVLAFYLIIKNLIVTGKVIEGLAGPVGIFVFTGEVARLGFIYLLQFTALISLNLAVINALPFPALDGGRALFILIEKIKGSPVNQRIEQMVHNVGFALLIILIILITFRDVGRFF